MSEIFRLEIRIRSTDYQVESLVYCLYVAVVEAGSKGVLGQSSLKTTRLSFQSMGPTIYSAQTLQAPYRMVFQLPFSNELFCLIARNLTWRRVNHHLRTRTISSSFFQVGQFDRISKCNIEYLCQNATVPKENSSTRRTPTTPANKEPPCSGPSYIYLYIYRD